MKKTINKQRKKKEVNIINFGILIKVFRYRKKKKFTSQQIKKTKKKHLMRVPTASPFNFNREDTERIRIRKVWILIFQPKKKQASNTSKAFAIRRSLQKFSIETLILNSWLELVLRKNCRQWISLETWTTTSNKPSTIH